MEAIRFAFAFADHSKIFLCKVSICSTDIFPQNLKGYKPNPALYCLQPKSRNLLIIYFIYTRLLRLSIKHSKFSA